MNTTTMKAFRKKKKNMMKSNYIESYDNLNFIPCLKLYFITKISPPLMTKLKILMLPFFHFMDISIVLKKIPQYLVVAFRGVSVLTK
jgi:hypothetical protein